MILIYLPDEAATLRFGNVLAHSCQRPCVIFLHGELGAGKTTLVRGILRGFGYQGIVKSPTYTLVENYNITDISISHFDLYRLTTPEELESFGFRDYLANQDLCLIEWPERGDKILPKPDLSCYIRAKDSGREIMLSANTEYGQQTLQKYRTMVQD